MLRTPQILTGLAYILSRKLGKADKTYQFHSGGHCIRVDSCMKILRYLDTHTIHHLCMGFLCTLSQLKKKYCKSISSALSMRYEETISDYSPTVALYFLNQQYFYDNTLTCFFHITINLDRLAPRCSREKPVSTIRSQAQRRVLDFST